MPSATITPVRSSNPGTSMADLYTGPDTNEEATVDVRVCNKTAAALTYRLYITASADNSEASGAYRCYDKTIAAYDALDVEYGLSVPNGYKLRHRASATGLDVSVTGRKRSTL